MDVANVGKWLDLFGQAWRDRNPQGAAELFTVDAVYRSDPFRQPLVGRTAIADYWARATGSQSAIQVRFGDPLVQGDRVAVEWWSTVMKDGASTTDAGGLFLTFEAERCAELREYWNLAEEAVGIPEGWGR